MNKYRLGKKQSRVILDENGHEVAIFTKEHTIEAQLCCDSLNKFFNGETVKLREGCVSCGVKLGDKAEIGVTSKKYLAQSLK